MTGFLLAAMVLAGAQRQAIIPIDAESLRLFGASCDGARIDDRRHDLPEPSLITLFKSGPDGEWARRPSLQIAALEAKAHPDVTTVVCVTERQVSAGDFENAAGIRIPARVTVWEVRLVHDLDRVVLAGRDFYGERPPDTYRGLTPFIGKPPNPADVTAWIRSRMLALALPKSGLQVQMPPGSTWTVTPLDDRDRLQSSSGLMATVYVERTGRLPDCRAWMRPAESMGKSVNASSLTGLGWWTFMIETPDFYSVCAEVGVRLLSVIVGPVASIKGRQDVEQTVRDLLRGVREGVLRLPRN